MEITVNKEDLISLIKGQYISFKAAEDQRIKLYGDIWQPHDEWKWKAGALEKETEEGLYELFNYIKGLND